MADPYTTTRTARYAISELKGKTLVNVKEGNTSRVWKRERERPRTSQKNTEVKPFMGLLMSETRQNGSALQEKANTPGVNNHFAQCRRDIYN